MRNMFVTLNPINFNNFQYNCTKPVPKKTGTKLSPLGFDTVNFSGNVKKDLMSLPAQKIIEICEKAIKEGTKLGQGKEAFAYKIEDYPEYCIRQERRYSKSDYGYKLNKALNKYDVVNHVVARLDEGTTLMKYVSGMPIKIVSAIDPKRTVKENIQGLLSLEFPERSFKKVLKQIEDAKCKDIDFDRFGENLHVDPLNYEMTCIDFSPYIKDTTGEYNPISYIYSALDVDGTTHAQRVFGKLCSAYAQRLVETPINRLNFDKLDTNFYHRGFEGDAFNLFQDRELLQVVQKHIEELIEAKKQHIPRAKLQEKVNKFKEFVNKTLMPIKNDDYYEGHNFY